MSNKLLILETLKGIELVYKDLLCWKTSFLYGREERGCLVLFWFLWSPRMNTLHVIYFFTLDKHGWCLGHCQRCLLETDWDQCPWNYSLLWKKARFHSPEIYLSYSNVKWRLFLHLSYVRFWLCLSQGNEEIRFGLKTKIKYIFLNTIACHLSFCFF